MEYKLIWLNRNRLFKKSIVGGIKMLRVPKLISFIVLMVMILSLPVVAYGEQTGYTISSYNINVNILKDGSAEVEEKITYQFDGEFNGIFFNVDHSGTKGIEEYQVNLLEGGNEQKLTLNGTGEPMTYTYSDKDNIAKFKVFLPSKNEERTFIFRYRLRDVVVKYNDIAEFNRKLVGRNWQVGLNNIRIKLLLPEGASKDEIKVFAHGPLTGESRLIDGKNCEFIVPYVSPGTFVETRILFPVKIVPDSQNIVNKNVLDEILQQEAQWAREANQKREEAKKKLEREARLSKIGKYLTILLIITWAALLIILKRKYGTDPKTEFNGKYYRDLPGEYTPAEASVLITFGRVQSRDLMATLLDLVRKRVLILQKVDKNTGRFKRTKSDYVFSIREGVSLENLKSHEQFLINWFVDEIGDGSKFSISDIKEFVKSRYDGQRFKDNYDKWKELVKEEADNNGFFDKQQMGNMKKVLFTTSFTIAGILIGILMYPLASILMVTSIINFIYIFSLKKRTEYGSDQYKKMMALKRFLKDFSSIDKASLPSVAVWEHYLVYAVSLGVAKEVIKALPLIIDREGQDALSSAGIAYVLWRTGIDTRPDKYFNDLVNDIGKEIESAARIADSSYSSETGTGGGMSSGDAGGGGGESGGGAF